MSFNDVSVKESPGLCRCCLSEGCYKDLGTEYTWMNENEVYADMLLDCFDIGITQHSDGPNGAKRLICEVCITRLRDACNFKKQVLDSEKKFVDMLGRGEFAPKVVLFPHPMKSETVEEMTIEDVDSTEVEYLDDIDYVPDEEVKEEEEITAPSSSKKRGRPKKEITNQSLKKQKVKEKTVKVNKGEEKKHENYLTRLTTTRKNICAILRYGTVLPFSWNTKGFRCFYCFKPMKDCDALKEHTSKHTTIDLWAFVQKYIIAKDVPIKLDVSDVACRNCPDPISSLEELISHVVLVHKADYDTSINECFLPFVLHKTVMNCVICGASYDNFPSIISHMYKEHIKHSFMCQICGLSFKDRVRLKRHLSISHVGHKCTICSKIFSAFHKLEKHKQRFHGQIKTYECNLCTAKFPNSYQVKVHMGKEHNVEKYMLKCEHCPKVCTTKGALVLHMQSIHSDVRFQCDLCDYTAGIQWLVKLHRRKHIGEKEYACSICERRFGRSSNLRAHMKVHTGSYGRCCRICRKGFTGLDALKEHETECHYYDNC